MWAILKLLMSKENYVIHNLYVCIYTFIDTFIGTNRQIRKKKKEIKTNR